MSDLSPLNAVLIGTGLVSSVYVDAIAALADEVRLAGALARRAGSATAFATAAERVLGYAPTPYISLDDVIGGRPDFAILATPPDARLEPIARLAEAGIPILTEKPVARTLDEARRIVDLCARQGVPLGVTLQHRARPSARTLADICASGALGRLAAVEISVPWWRPQTYYDQPGRGSYARDGGGVLINQAIHTLDLALFLAGPVEEVTAMVDTTVLHRMEAEDFVSAGLRFANGAVGNLFATTAAYPGRAEIIRLHHKNATAELRSARLRIDWQDGRSEDHGTETASGSGADPMAFSSDWHRKLISEFADSVRSGRPPMIPGASALSVHALIAAIEQAANTRTAVKVSPA